MRRMILGILWSRSLLFGVGRTRDWTGMGLECESKVVIREGGEDMMLDDARLLPEI